MCAYEPRWATAVGTPPFSQFGGMKTRTATASSVAFPSTETEEAHVCIFLPRSSPTQPDQLHPSAPKSTRGALQRDLNALQRMRVSEDGVLDALDSVVHTSQGERRKLSLIHI